MNTSISVLRKAIRMGRNILFTVLICSSFMSVISFVSGFSATNTTLPQNSSRRSSSREEDRKIDKKTAEEFAKERKLIFFEASAKSSDNVEKVFEYFTYKLFQYFDKNKDKYILDGSDNSRLNSSAQSIQTESKNEDKCNC